MNTETILCILLLSLWILLALFFIVRSVIDAVEDRQRKKRDAKWEEERQQMERDRAARELEYHTARMKDIKNQ